MKTIKVKNTRNIRVSGRPSEDILVLDNNEYIAISPSLISLIKPKLLVKAGDKVKIGTPMYIDKTDADLKFVSPASGVVEEIVYGERRAIDNVVIKCDGNEEYNTRASVDISSINAESLRKEIIDSGLWGLFRQFPFLNIPRTDEKLPSCVYVSLDNDEPHHPLSKIYLKDNLDDFKSGVKALEKLFKNVNIACSNKNKEVAKILDGVITHQIKGHYPANNAGSFLFYDKKDSSQNNSCTILGQDIIKLGHMLNTGKYLNKKIISIAGPMLDKPTHALINEGAKIDYLLSKENITTDHRIVAGGVLDGRDATNSGYLGCREHSINILSREIKQDLFGFMKLGFNKHTLSRTYFSFLAPKKDLDLDVSLNGEDRSCISCGICPTVCPVQIFPQEVMKNVLADNRNESLDLGMLDCIDCGLCTYACPSKIEISDIIANAKNNLHKELNA